jgi:hypothetical protein
MPAKQISVTLGRTYDDKPLATIHDSPCGDDSDLRPGQLREIAALLIKIADDADLYYSANKHLKNKFVRSKRTYSYGGV